MVFFKKQILFAMALAVFSMGAFALDKSTVVQVSTVLKTINSWDQSPFTYPAGVPEVIGMLVEVAPGGETGWHLHSVPSFGFMLEGDLEIRLKDGSTKRLKSGDAVVEVVNTLHNGVNVGTSPVKLIVFYAATVGAKLFEREHGHR